MKTIFILIIAVFMQQTAVIYCQLWISGYNGTGLSDDYSNSVAVDNSGNVYITGYSWGSGGNNEYATVKFNSSGVKQWSKTYNGRGNGDDKANSIAVDASGNVYITGSSLGNGTLYDIATIKYNSDGLLIWASRYNGPTNANDYGVAVAVDASGNVYCGGLSDFDYAVLKYNSTGVLQWVKTYNGPGPPNFPVDQLQSMAIDASGNVYVTGYSEGNGTDWDYATLKYNSAGTNLWVVRFNGIANHSDQAYSIAVDISGNVYVTGSSYVDLNNYKTDITTIKYNSSGVQQWVKYYDYAVYFDMGNSICTDGSGYVYVAGVGYNGNYPDYITIKYNSSGAKLWSKSYNGPANADDRARYIGVDASGNVFSTGFSQGSGSGYDFATVKYSPAGVLQWVERYSGPGYGDDQATGIAIDASGNSYVTGYSWISQIIGFFDYKIIKYSPSGDNITINGLNQTSSPIPGEYSLEQNYPNPFNPNTKIKFTNLRPGFVKLVVYDITGTELTTLVNSTLNTGTYEVSFDGSEFSSGTYFYRITAGDFTETKKMLLIK